MAYDDKGNYFFDPSSDMEDEEALATAKRTEQALYYLQGVRSREAHDRDMQAMFNETLKEEGITPEIYAQLFSGDPELSRALIKDNIKQLVSGVKKGRARDSQGQFVKAQGRSQQGRDLRHDEVKSLAALKEKARTQRLDSQDELDVIGALFPDPL